MLCTYYVSSAISSLRLSYTCITERLVYCLYGPLKIPDHPCLVLTLGRYVMLIRISYLPSTGSELEHVWH